MPSLSFQKVELDGYLNSNMIEMFLMGIYTIVYGWTIFIYTQRKDTNRISILGVITVIYVLSCIASAVDWYKNNQTFVAHGNTMFHAFNFMSNAYSYLDTINHTCHHLVILLADGLLMWRCCIVCTGSRRIAWISCVLWLVEAALSITLVIGDVLRNNTPSNAKIILLNTLTSALFFTSALTSMMSTFLIAYRIYVASRFSGASKSRFMNVIDIVVQSSAVYTLSVLVVAIYDVIPYPHSKSGRISYNMVVDYVGCVALVMIGMMPTLMVARVAMSSGNGGTTVASAGTVPGKPSIIHFQSRGADFRQSWVSADSDELDFYDEGRKTDTLDRV
ncbi:hypothetical protein CPC08DRAFT_706724 [Agrocybe pediades]|nr:hypothetical protein CPC08DRAFT_706724 [Agrocybe pediades]